MARCYEYAMELYNKKRYEEAGNILLVLIFLNPKVSAFWVGLGFSEEMKEVYQSALLSYLMALEVNPEDLKPALYAASMHLRLKEKEKAKFLLDQAIEQAGNDPKYAEVRTRALHMKEGI